MNSWIAQNMNLISFFSITLTILFTLINVYFARNSQKYSADTVKQNNEIRKENNTPNIIAYFDIGVSKTLDFKVANIGNNAAKNIIIKMQELNETVANENYLNRSSLIGNPISFLAPNQTLKTLVGLFFRLKNADGYFPIYKLAISYEDIDNRKYKREYIIDSNVYKGNINTDIKTVNELTKEVMKIEKHLDKLQTENKSSVL